MPLQVDDITTLQKYLAGVDDRAVHHGPDVGEVVFPLIGAVVRYKDTDENIKVHKATKSFAGNVLWVHVGGRKYSLSYDHQKKAIVMRAGSIQGKEVAAFTNKTSTKEIVTLFKDLSQQ